MKNVSKLAKQLVSYDKKTFDDRLSRLQFISDVIGQPEYIHSPGLAVQFFEEAKTCFVDGSFLATIVMCQLTCEEMLKSYYRNIGKIGNVEVNFSRLIELAEEDNVITAKESDIFDELRVITNEIKHSRTSQDLAFVEGKNYCDFFILSLVTITNWNKLQNKP